MRVIQKIFLTLIACASIAKGQYTSLFDFNGPNGSNPEGSLISDGSFLYGMTHNDEWGVDNRGTIFKIKPDGTGFSKLLQFNGANGVFPGGSFIYDGEYLYGMTANGGTNDNGVVFKIKPDGTNYTKLLNFNQTNGYRPSGSLIYDGIFLYGMTYWGGTIDAGVVFRIKPDGTAYTKLLDFTGTNGSNPNGDLVSDGTFLYGMTAYGGTNNKGTIFKLMTDGSGYSKLLDFGGNSSGSIPLGSLIFDGTFLYGMTSEGGTDNVGTIFKIKRDGTGYVTLLNFNILNGWKPYGSLFSDGTFLYGMTTGGGSQGMNGRGVVFKIKTDGTGYGKLLDFTGLNGNSPYGNLISDGSFLYGMTTGGGTGGEGKIFRIGTNDIAGISTNESNPEISIFPNPASSVINIKYSGFGKRCTIEMTTILGEKVLYEQLILKDSILDTQKLETGLYFIRVTQDGEIIATKKVLIEK